MTSGYAGQHLTLGRPSGLSRYGRVASQYAARSAQEMDTKTTAAFECRRKHDDQMRRLRRESALRRKKQRLLAQQQDQRERQRRNETLKQRRAKLEAITKDGRAAIRGELPTLPPRPRRSLRGTRNRSGTGIVKSHAQSEIVRPLGIPDAASDVFSLGSLGQDSPSVISAPLPVRHGRYDASPVAERHHKRSKHSGSMGRDTLEFVNLEERFAHEEDKIKELQFEEERLEQSLARLDQERTELYAVPPAPLVNVVEVPETAKVPPEDFSNASSSALEERDPLTRVPPRRRRKGRSRHSGRSRRERVVRDVSAGPPLMTRPSQISKTRRSPRVIERPRPLLGHQMQGQPVSMLGNGTEVHSSQSEPEIRLSREVALWLRGFKVRISSNPAKNFTILSDGFVIGTILRTKLPRLLGTAVVTPGPSCAIHNWRILAQVFVQLSFPLSDDEFESLVNATNPTLLREIIDNVYSLCSTLG